MHQKALKETRSRLSIVFFFFFGQQTGIENDDSVGDDTKALGVGMASTSASDNTLKAKTPFQIYDKQFVHDWLSPTNPHLG